MSLILEIVNYTLIAIMFGVSGAWLILLKGMLQSFSKTPYLDKFENSRRHSPKVSIILPARNEERFISKCLDSLLNQDYENYEIIAIDDSSDDNTGRIIEQYSQKNSKIIHVSAREKPDGWMGKNWACVEGYKKSTGELLLFTDSDTKHARNVLSLAVSHLLSSNLDALTAIPKMVCLDFWTKITLPMISTFLHTRFSALRVNDPSKKTGYFFGNGTINLFSACHRLDTSLAHIASIRCSALTIFILYPDSLTFFPSAPSSIISSLTPSCVPTES